MAHLTLLGSSDRLGTAVRPNPVVTGAPTRIYRDAHHPRDIIYHIATNGWDRHTPDPNGASTVAGSPPTITVSDPGIGSGSRPLTGASITSTSMPARSASISRAVAGMPLLRMMSVSPGR